MLRPGLLSLLTGLSLADGVETDARLTGQARVFRKFPEIDNFAVLAR